jgi:molybdopterin-guanine dinucleotide biosynthesis protein B
VLIEGYKREPHPKLEVHREAVGMPLLALADPAVVAIASDVALPSAPVPVLDLNDVEGIVEILISRAVPLDAALARAGVA